MCAAVCAAVRSGWRHDHEFESSDDGLTLFGGHVEPVPQVVQREFQPVLDGPGGELSIDEEGVVERIEHARQCPAGL